MPCWEGKRYMLESQDNFDGYLKALGVGMVIRKVALIAHPVVELRDNYDGSYTLTTSAPFKTTTITFRLGEEFDEQTVDDRCVRSVCTMNGDTLIREQRGDRPSTIIHEFSDDQLVSTLTAGGVRCTRIFRAC